jgi:hypothetical protein
MTLGWHSATRLPLSGGACARREGRSSEHPHNLVRSALLMVLGACIPRSSAAPKKSLDNRQLGNIASFGVSFVSVTVIAFESFGFFQIPSGRSIKISGFPSFHRARQRTGQRTRSSSMPPFRKPQIRQHARERPIEPRPHRQMTEVVAKDKRLSLNGKHFNGVPAMTRRKLEAHS